MSGAYFCTKCKTFYSDRECGRCVHDKEDSLGYDKYEDDKDDPIEEPVQAMHHSAGKLGFDQLDWRVLAEDALVLNYGEMKYARDNWRNGTDYHEMFGSAIRHIFAWWMGEGYDPESGLSHLSHARINLMFLRNWTLDEKGNDDRPDPSFLEYMQFFREDLVAALQKGAEAHR